MCVVISGTEGLPRRLPPRLPRRHCRSPSVLLITTHIYNMASNTLKILVRAPAHHNLHLGRLGVPLLPLWTSQSRTVLVSFAYHPCALWATIHAWRSGHPTHWIALNQAATLPFALHPPRPAPDRETRYASSPRGPDKMYHLAKGLYRLATSKEGRLRTHPTYQPAPDITH